MNKSKIEWLQDRDGTPGSTWNPLRGKLGMWHCVKVSPGCAHCYAERLGRRFGSYPYEEGYDELATITDADLGPPFRWRKPRKVFVCSMSDLFLAVPATLNLIFAVMVLNWRHTFLVLTKRAGAMQAYMTATGVRESITDAARRHYGERAECDVHNLLYGEVKPGVFWPPRNVWLGVTAENHLMAYGRVPLLMKTPAEKRFVSCEPLLTDVLLGEYLHPSRHFRPGLDWVIAGGESGSEGRPMDPHWARTLRDECQQWGVPYFFKQWGAWAPPHVHRTNPTIPGPSTTIRHVCGSLEVVYRIRPGGASRELDGREWSEIPDEAEGWTEAKAAVTREGQKRA